MTQFKNWKRNGYRVQERPFDGSLHEFDIMVDDELGGYYLFATINPNTLENQAQIITDLDAGEDVDGWEDGMGNTINLEEAGIETE